MLFACATPGVAEIDLVSKRFEVMAASPTSHVTGMIPQQASLFPEYRRHQKDFDNLCCPKCSRKSLCTPRFAPSVTLTRNRSISAGAKSKVKSSVQRAIRNKVVETYPLLAAHIDEIMPKKSQLDLLKLSEIPAQLIRINC